MGAAAGGAAASAHLKTRESSACIAVGMEFSAFGLLKVTSMTCSRDSSTMQNCVSKGSGMANGESRGFLPVPGAQSQI
jgi:hypothetical protein